MGAAAQAKASIWPHFASESRLMLKEITLRDPPKLWNRGSGDRRLPSSLNGWRRWRSHCGRRDYRGLPFAGLGPVLRHRPDRSQP